ncbi:MAG TPA: YdeI/OmpD-associated family protein [Nitrolancea sp.]|nr:YdeI/OmpD-associated family protein [Nitrolancea sp.]
MKFRAVILLSGKTATGIQVPPEVVEALGSGKKPAVNVTIGDYIYRSTVAMMDGKFMVPVSAEVRAGAGVAAGDEVEVSLELDTSPRDVSVPDDFAAALAGDDEAMRFFESLSYSNKRRIVIPIDEAKTPETRERRIAKAVEKLRENQL